MRRSFLPKAVALAAVALVTAGPLAAQGRRAAPARVILFIGDGVGTSYWTAALLAADRLAIQDFPVVGLVDTQASDSKVTDSAAGATAYAAGVRTFNGAIGVAPDSSPVQTVLELAAARGMATGLVATSRITHATPAAFAAHVPNRNLEWEIARQMAAHDVTVVLGGGRALFSDRYRPDSLDLLGPVKQRYSYIETAEELRALNPARVKALFGLFTESHMPAAITRQPVDSAGPAPADSQWVPTRFPTLPEMTRAALAVLDRDPDGFFLMVEASQPDWRGHGNEPLETVVAEMLDFDGAIREALQYQARRSHTLIVITADHETGGLAVQLDSTGAVVAAYTTLSHTAQLVPLFAKGPGAERFGGVQTADAIGRLLIETVQRGAAAAQGER